MKDAFLAFGTRDSSGNYWVVIGYAKAIWKISGSGVQVFEPQDLPFSMYRLRWGAMEVGLDGTVYLVDKYENGVAAYDGNEWKVFGNDPDLEGRSVFDMVADKHGMLWLASHGGLLRFDGQNYDWHPNPLSDSTLPILQLAYHPEQDVLWLSTREGVVRYDFQAMTKVFSDQYFGFLHADSKHRLWAYNEPNMTLQAFDFEGDELANFELREAEVDSGLKIFRIAEVGEEALAIATTWEGLLVLDGVDMVPHGAAYRSLVPEFSDQKLGIFPNPTSGNIRVVLHDFGEDLDAIHIYDSQGRLVLK
ncbi:MAG: hypothetical protein AAF570_26945, partial [Bacteroidota bacterium]